jgi:hypothetical protein
VQRRVQRGVLLPIRVHVEHGGPQWWRMHSGVLLPRGLDERHRQRRVHVQRWELLSRGFGDGGRDAGACTLRR